MARLRQAALDAAKEDADDQKQELEEELDDVNKDKDVCEPRLQVPLRPTPVRGCCEPQLLTLRSSTGAPRSGLALNEPTHTSVCARGRAPRCH